MHEAEWAKWEWAKWEWLSGNLLLSENALSGNALASGLRHLREETVVRPWHATQDGRLFSAAPRSGDLAYDVARDTWQATRFMRRRTPGRASRLRPVPGFRCPHWVVPHACMHELAGAHPIRH